jgi:selenide,water dikinase
LERRLREDPASIGFLPDKKFKLTLLTGAERVGSGMIDSTRDRIESQLSERGIEVKTNARVVSIDGGRLGLKDATAADFDAIIWATSAVAPSLLADLDLEKDARGFLKTRTTLQTVSDDAIFAVGDTGTFVDHDLPKAGVYAVRQGPVLWDNLKRSVWRRELIAYRPQRKFLKLVNTANGKAIAEYGQRSFVGGLFWFLKDRIDRKFMRMYQDYSPMEMAPAVVKTEEVEMRCLGCGGKIGSQLLSSILDELDVKPHPDVIIGLDQPDDAAIVRTKTIK